MTYFAYILASGKKGALYIGSTNNLKRRVQEHKRGTIKGFTSKYNVNRLVYYEKLDNFQEALDREKQIKKWNREWKIDLIIKNNPVWNDLQLISQSVK